MKFKLRNCLINPLVNVKPSEKDLIYLNEMRQFISNNLKIFLSNYIKENDNIGYIGLTGHIFEDNFNDKKFNLYTIDIDPNNNPTFLADITKNNESIIKNNMFDILICTEVLEHTKNPIDAIYELTRMLKPNGFLILSTPFNFRIHGPLPDNFRFTEWFYKDILSYNYNIIEMTSLEDIERELCPINYFIVSKKK